MKSKHLLWFAALLILGMFQSLNGQVFQNMGNGISTGAGSGYYGAMEVYEHQGDVYAFFEELTYNPYVRTPILKKWDGFSWSTMPAIPRGRVTSMRVYNGDLYIAADDWWTNGNLFRFDGTSWTPVFSNFSGYIMDMEIDNNTLVCAGAFAQGSPTKHNILAFDGTSVIAIPSLAITDTVYDLNIIANELWVAGDFDQAGGAIDSVDVKKLTNGANWERPVSVFNNPSQIYDGSTVSVFGYNGGVYASDNNRLYELTNDTAYLISPNRVMSYVQFGGMMYITDANTLKLFDGTTVTPIGISPYGVRSITANSTHLFGMFSDTTQINGLDFGHIFQLGAQSFGLLKGKVYADMNVNCSYDSGSDIALAKVIMGASGIANSYVATDQTGNYSVYLPAGRYSLQQPGNLPYVQKYYTLSCGSNLNATIVSGQTLQKDFVFSHNGSIDVASQVFMNLGHRSRQGFTESGTLLVKNPGATINQSVTVKLTLPSTVSLVSSTPSYTSGSGNVYSYNIPSLPHGSNYQISFKVKIDLANNNIGDTLKWYSEVVPVSGDVDLSNDKDTTWTMVVGAYDPNDKTASEWQSLPGLSRLDYHIRFQNTGTDTAYKVVIVDTLESYFDPASITINGASHDYSFHIADNSVIAWTFDNILLPDSGASYGGSQGFVNFSVDVDPTLKVGDIIDNDAEIYFDFQPAVHTNHAQTAIVSVLDIEEFMQKQSSFSVYPNPAQELFYIENTINQRQEVKLINTTGQVIRSISLQPEMKAGVRTESLAPGMYFINNGTNTHRIIITP